MYDTLTDPSTHENSMSLHDAKIAPPVITARLRSTSGVATCLCQKKSPVTMIRFVKLLNTVTCRKIAANVFKS